MSKAEKSVVKGKLGRHPTVLRVLPTLESRPPGRLQLDALRDACLAAGADDVGFVSIDRPELDTDRDDILVAMPGARTLVAFVVRMNPTAIQSTARSIANLEFHRAGERTNHIAAKIADALIAAGHRALNPAMGFPMEMDRFPGKIWVISHKRVAEAAGLGVMGIHRNVIHPEFGNFILLGTVVTDAVLEDEAENQRLDYNPCLECKLCVAACPVGAIKPDGAFDFSACYVHNYREFMGGFTDWVGEIADAKDRTAYRRRVSDSESASMWQSLSFGANYKAAYCMAVCPAGEDNIRPYLRDKPRWTKQVVRPLQAKEETVYVQRGSDAQAYVQKRFPHKQPKEVRSGLKPTSIAGFARGAPVTFQPGKAKGLPRTTYHFEFVGREPAALTFVVEDGRLEVLSGHVGDPDLHVTADSETWLGFLAGERNMVWALLTRRVRLRGPLKLLQSFGDCFPDA